MRDQFWLSAFVKRFNVLYITHDCYYGCECNLCLYLIYTYPYGYSILNWLHLAQPRCRSNSFQLACSRRLAKVFAAKTELNNYISRADVW